MDSFLQDVRTGAVDLVMSGVRELVGSATAPIVESIASKLNTTSTWIIVTGAIILVIGALLIGVFVWLAVDAKKRSAFGISTSGAAWVAGVIVLITGMLWAGFGVGTIIVGADAKNLANQFSQRAARIQHNDSNKMSNAARE